MQAASEQSVGTDVFISRKTSSFRKLWSSRALLLMCLPAIFFFFIFAYLPMPGLYLAFINYNYSAGIFHSPFIGLQNFRFLVMTGELWHLTWNTIAYNLAFIVIGNVLQITIAVLLNEIRSKYFKKISQSIMFLPYFISFVLIGLIVYDVLNYEYGSMNVLLKSFGMQPIDWYSSTGMWKYILVVVYLWQSTGYGSIVYFAAIMGLDSEVLEAAEIDGANAFQRIRHIVLPWLKPTFIILLLFSLGGVLRGNFQLFYNLIGHNTLLYPQTDIIETYVFRALMQDFNFSMGSAVSLYQSVVGFIIVVSANWMIKKLSPENTLF